MLDIVNEHAHRVRFATRNAESIVWRNILKRYVARQKLDPKHLTVSVVSWQQPDREHIDQLTRLVDGVRGGSFVIDGDEPITMDVTTETATIADPDSERSALSGDEDSPQMIDAKPAEPAAVGGPEMVSQPVMEGGPAVVADPVGATRERAQAAVEKGTVSGAVVEAREKVRSLWAKLGGDKAATDASGHVSACWNVLTGCGFETLQEALTTPDLAWIGQLVGGLEEIQLKRASATAHAKRSVSDEKPGPPAAADGGSPVMRPPPAPPNETITEGYPPPAHRLFDADNAPPR